MHQITVIIPTYNRAKVLPRAIKSIQEQTFKDWLLIIVDDKSTDNTSAVLHQAALADKRISYHILDKNKGANSARNKGVELSKTELIAFLDSDDEMASTALEKLAAKLASSSNIGFCYAGADIRFENKRIALVHPKVKGQLEKYLFKHLTGLGASFSGSLTRKEVCRHIGGFSEILRSQQDLDFMLRVARYYAIDYIEDLYCITHTDSNNRISDNRLAKMQGEIELVRLHKDRAKEIGVYHTIIRKLARKYAIYVGDLKAAYKCIGKSIACRPFYFYAYLYALKLPFLYLKNKK